MQKNILLNIQIIGEVVITTTSPISQLNLKILGQKNTIYYLIIIIITHRLNLKLNPYLFI